MKVFDRWDVEGISVEDRGLVTYINLSPLFVPRTGGRNAGPMWKARTFIVERLINKLMIPGHRGKKHKLTSGHATGKALHTAKIVEEAFMLIEDKTKQNPIKVFVKAVENAAPREEIISIEYGGARYPQAVDSAPSRRIDIALRMMVQGSYSKSFKSKRTIAECLADEILKAYNLDPSSTAIAKKLELERQADASR